jgi:hypothetical protein
MKQPVLSSPIRGEVFARFHAVYRIDCLACQNDFFDNNTLNIKENNERALDFALYLSRLLLVSVSSDFPCTAQAFLPERLAYH